MHDAIHDPEGLDRQLTRLLVMQDVLPDEQRGAYVRELETMVRIQGETIVRMKDHLERNRQRYRTMNRKGKK